MDFDAWWQSRGQYLDPDTSDVPWIDKRRFLAELTWNAALAISRNYTADHSVLPQEIIFSNGRIVKMKGSGHLYVTDQKQKISET